MIKLFLTDVDGCLTDSTYIVLPAGGWLNGPGKVFNTRDWHGMAKLDKAGCRVGIISGDDSRSVKDQVLRCAGYAALFQGISDKRKFVQETYIDSGKYMWEEIAFVGDDTNDIELLQKVGWVACPADAMQEVKDVVKKLIDGVVLYHNGGRGCVREFVDEIRKTEYNG